MTGTLDVMLEVVFRLGDIDEHRKDVAQVFFVVGYAHAFAAATRYWFEDDRIADFLGNFDSFFVAGQRVAAFSHRNTGWSDGSAGDIFVADEADGFRHRSNPGNTGIGYLLGKVCILGEEAIARMNCISLGLFSSCQQGVFVQIAFQSISRAYADSLVSQLDMQSIGIGLGVDSDGFNVELLAGTNNTNGDFAAVSNKNAFKHRITS